VKDNTAKRIRKVKNFLKKNNLQAILVTNLINIRYLSGFTGTTASMIVTQNKSFFITDFRYIEQSEKEVTCSKILEFRSSVEGAADVCKKEKIKKLAVEEGNLTLSLFNNLKKTLSSVKLMPVSGIIEKFRSIKDEAEINLIRDAIIISNKSLAQTMPVIKAGISERDVAVELEYRLKKLGAEKMAFDFIVASGYRSALPHGVGGNKKIKHGDIITIDFGCVYKGYHSDITRTFCLGKASAEKLRIYNLVFKAQSAALRGAKSGIACGELDAYARDVFTKENMGRYFGHGLGHGVGLDIHEEPAVTKGIKQKIEEGMVLTIEPGLYIPGKFGVRIEDMVLIKKEGAEVLTKQIKKIFEL